MRLMKMLPVGDVASLAILVAAGILLLVGSQELPGPEFDPLGPAGMPKYIAYALLALSAVLLGQILSAARRGAKPGTAPRTSLPQTVELVLSAACVLGYLTALTVGGLPFSVVTVVFLSLAGFTMTHFRVSKLPIVVVIAVVVSFGLTFVFRDVLHVILPG